MNTQEKKHDEHSEVEETDAAQNDVVETDVVQTDTVQTEYSPEHSDAPGDVETDPALDDRLGSDWVDEGGATSVGPATSTPGNVETEESKRQVRIDREREEQEAAE